jgi:hypothetical protein
MLDRISQLLIFIIGISFMVIVLSDHAKTLYHFALVCLIATIGLIVLDKFQDGEND